MTDQKPEYQLGPKTEDQRLYRVGGRLKAEIDVDVSDEIEGTPSIQESRHAVLPLYGKDNYVIYDRLLGRIVDGVYSLLSEALAVADYFNTDPHAPQDMTPSSAALGLLYPKKRRKGSRKPMKEAAHQCQRCGRTSMRWSRVLTTGRVVCFWCYADLSVGSKGKRAIDDGVVKTWEETMQMRRQYRAGLRKSGKWEAADAAPNTDVAKPD